MRKKQRDDAFTEEQRKILHDLLVDDEALMQVVKFLMGILKGVAANRIEPLEKRSDAIIRHLVSEGAGASIRAAALEKILIEKAVFSRTELKAATDDVRACYMVERALLPEEPKERKKQARRRTSK